MTGQVTAVRKNKALLYRRPLKYPAAGVFRGPRLPPLADSG